MNKYQKCLKHLSKAQRLLNALMQERQESPENTTQDCDIQELVMAVLIASKTALSPRDIGARCRAFRRMTLASKTEMLEKMIADGLIGSKKTSRTVKYFAIEG